MKAYFQYVKILVAIGLLTILFIKIDVVESLSYFYHIHPLAISAIFIVIFFLIFVSVLKWQIFLKSLHLVNSFWSLYRYYIIGYFFSNFLPSNIGGDIVRLSLAAKGKDTYMASFVAVFMERFTGIIATLIFVSISIPLAFWYFDYFDRLYLIVFSSFAMFIFITGIFFIKFDYFDRYMPEEGFIKKIIAKIKEISSLIHSFKNKKRVLFTAMILSLIFNFLTIVNVYVVGFALDIQLSFIELFILVPIIILISTIPLSINAIGIAEGAYVLCLGAIGVSSPEALSIALLIRASTLIVSLLGGLFFLSYRKHQNFENVTISRR